MYKNLFIILVLLCSCKQQRTDNPLLNGNQYTLWYLKESGNENPKFLYIDCYKKFSVLSFDIHTGSFFPTSENKFPIPLSGRWKYKAENTIYLKNTPYSIHQAMDSIIHFYETDTKEGIEEFFYTEYLDVIVLQNQNISNSYITLRDTKFPIKLYGYYESEKKQDEAHYQKWGKKIKNSPLLVGRDYNLWRTKQIGYPPNSYNYYYYDKYGKNAFIYLSGEYWTFDNPYNQEIITASYWYQHKDTLHQYRNKYKFLNKKGDTLQLESVKDKYKWELIETNIKYHK